MEVEFSKENFLLPETKYECEYFSPIVEDLYVSLLCIVFTDLDHTADVQ